MKNVLVTGGAGFIGSNFIRHLLEKWNVEIVNIDKLTYAGNKKNLTDMEKKKQYSFVKGDITDKKIVQKAMKECDTVFNFAAETHVDRSIANSSEFMHTNMIGVHTLLEAARKLDVKTFIQVSTDEVYGSIESGFVDENGVLNPSNPYSASKAGADLLALSYSKTHGMDVRITRSSNNFGPFQFPEKIIPLFITNILEGKKIPIYGAGKNKRDWLFVKDNCKAILLVANKGKKGEIYNIGSGSELSNLELSEKLLAIMGGKKEMMEFVKDRPGHDYRYALDFEKIKALGFAPSGDFDSKLRHTVDWYKQNGKWWKQLKKRGSFK